MRAPRVPVEEQYRLIMECRKSGLSDHQWCLNNDINPGTFYNWVKRLRKNGCGDEYSRAITPQIRQAGNRLSGLAETAYASLLA